jgi:hypothetical protein
MQFYNVGLLRYGDWNPVAPDYNSMALWQVRGTDLDIRIPWAMAGLSDPSSHQALIPLGVFKEKSVTIGGIGLTIADDDGPGVQAGTIRWPDWETVRYTERIKPGISALQEAFATVSQP